MEKKRRGIKGVFWGRAVLLGLAAVFFAGCGNRGTETKDAEASKEQIADVVQIPEDGIITQAQFEAFEGTDRVITFEGQSGDISYKWEYPGRNIHNATDMDLSVDFTVDEKSLAGIRSLSGDAPFAIGMELKGTGLITVPTLTVKLPEAWDADTAVFCKEKDGKAMKLSDAGMTTEGSGTDARTVLSVKVTEVGDTYYVVAGLSGEAMAARQEAEISSAGSGSSALPETFEDEDGRETEESETDELSDDGFDETEEPEQGSGQDRSEEIEPDKQDDSDKEPSSKKDSSTKDKDSSSEKEAEDAEKIMTCTVSISCSTILDNMDDLEKGKEEFVPADGWILEPTEVEFTEGDSVFDVLLAVCKAAGIHMEHSYTPLYGSEYVEGINQLYEFDCGEKSGWMYNVDSWFPNYGCDKYILSDGETIQWVYTCDLGRDVGDNSMWE